MDRAFSPLVPAPCRLHFVAAWARMGCAVGAVPRHDQDPFDICLLAISSSGVAESHGSCLIHLGSAACGGDSGSPAIPLEIELTYCRIMDA